MLRITSENLTTIFSNSYNSSRLRRGIMTLMVFGYLTSIGIYFSWFYLSILLPLLVTIPKIYRTLKTQATFPEEAEDRQLYSTSCRIFNLLVSVWKCAQTRLFMRGVVPGNACFTFLTQMWLFISKSSTAPQILPPFQSITSFTANRKVYSRIS